MADTLSEICSAVSPDYEFLQPSTDSIDIEVVLHEVLQRLLLQWYYKVTTVTPNARNLYLQAEKTTLHFSQNLPDLYQEGFSGTVAGSSFSEMEAGFSLGFTGEACLDPGTSRMRTAFDAAWRGN
jgi:hypothetical protein